MIAVLTVLQEILYWAAELMVVCVVVSYWAPQLEKHRHRITVTALGALTLAVAARWVVSGHPPIFGTFENSLAGSWSILVFLMALERGFLDGFFPRVLGRWLSLWMPAMLVVGLFFQRLPVPLTISERSLFIDVHVTLAWVAHTLLLATSTAALLVVAGRAGEAEAEWDGALFRGAGMGFAFFTMMIAVGSVYSYLLFSDWFKWEITETFAAAAWLVYGLAIHAALFFGWRGKKLAWVLLIALPLMLATFWVWSFYPGTYHHFEIPMLRAS